MRVIPPVLVAGWATAQILVTRAAGGRHRFRGQTGSAIALGLASSLVGTAAVTQFVHHRTTFHPEHPDRTSALVTDGVYALSRNPMYVALALALAAHAVWTGRARTLLAVPGFLLTLRPQVDAEEQALVRLFGDPYLDYTRRVPRWL